MLKTTITASVALALTVVAPAAYAKDRLSFSEDQAAATGPLSGVGVKGGGFITVKPGSSYSVTVLDGAEAVVLYKDGNSLSIECKRPCRGNVRRVIEVTAPSGSPISNLAIAGGGSMTVESGFESVSSLNVAVAGGGGLDASRQSASNVNAAVTGGGSISVTFTGSLDAAVVGGGSISYDGDPSRVTSSTIGGGSIRQR